MDFLDPKKQRRNKIVLSLGYVLIAVAIGFATLILLYWAKGFGLGKNGEVIQNGLVFFSSQPSGAQIYMDGKLKGTTNSRMRIPAATYDVTIARDGYRDWHRSITIKGGGVQRFDYPFLFPVKLVTNQVAAFEAAPVLSTQSPDRRWLLIARAGESGGFVEYDLSKPQSSALNLKIPETVYARSEGADSWAVSEWSTDNRHVLLTHHYVAGGNEASEYIMFDRQAPENSTNVTRALNLSAEATITLFNKKFDQFYIFNQTAGTLDTASLSDPTPTSRLTRVLAYKSYGTDRILYVTNESPTGTPEAGKVRVVLAQGQKTYALRDLPADAPKYLLDLATYDGNWYIAAGASTDKYVYIYKNPQVQIDALPDSRPVIKDVLKVNQPQAISFSLTARYIMAENGQNFSVFDAETANTYTYTLPDKLDEPQSKAVWMDGDRLTLISNGRLVVFDHDGQNKQVLQSANPAYEPFFAPDYKFVYNFAGPLDGDSKDVARLTSTALTVTK